MLNLPHPALAQLNGLQALCSAPNEPAAEPGPVGIQPATSADAPDLARAKRTRRLLRVLRPRHS